MTGTKEDWNKGEAMGGLIWIIVIVVVISEIKKFQRKTKQASRKTRTIRNPERVLTFLDRERRLTYWS